MGLNTDSLLYPALLNLAMRRADYCVADSELQYCGRARRGVSIQLDSVVCELRSPVESTADRPRIIGWQTIHQNSGESMIQWVWYLAGISYSCRDSK